MLTLFVLALSAHGQKEIIHHRDVWVDGRRMLWDCIGDAGQWGTIRANALCRYLGHDRAVAIDSYYTGNSLGGWDSQDGETLFRNTSCNSAYEQVIENIDCSTSM